MQKHRKGIKKLDLNGRTVSFLELANRLKNLDRERLEVLYEMQHTITRGSQEKTYVGL
jgi:hypothetical protein